MKRRDPYVIPDNPAEASLEFRRRNGVDPARDPLIGAAVEAARVAAYLADVQRACAWAREANDLLARRPAQPRLPVRCNYRSRVVVSASLRDWIDGLLKPIFAHSDSLHAAIAVLVAQSGLAHVLVVSQAIHAPSAQRPLNIEEGAFAYTLDTLWRAAGRGPLRAYDAALLARALDIGEQGDQPERQWSRRLQQVRKFASVEDPERVRPETVYVHLMLSELRARNPKAACTPARLARYLIDHQ